MIPQKSTWAWGLGDKLPLPCGPKGVWGELGFGVVSASTRGRLVVNHLIEHHFLSAVQLDSLLEDLDRVPLSERAPMFNENPPIVGRPQDFGTRRRVYANYGGGNHHKHTPHKKTHTRSVTPDRRPGDYQHAACRILNGIAKRTETTLQALPLGTLGKAQALAALQGFKQALKDETSGIPLREGLPSASRADEKDFDVTSTKVFLTSPAFQRQFVDCLKDHVPTVRSPGQSAKSPRMPRQAGWMVRAHKGCSGRAACCICT